MKKALCLLLTLLMIFTLAISSVYASDSDDFQNNEDNNKADFEIVSGESLNLKVKSAVLMDAKTGALLFAKKPNEALAPASVTKIMTLLLVAEAIENGSITTADKVIISQNAAGMGGSQVFLEEGESFTVEELLKCTVIASANDAAVALAEHVAGSESEFVRRMNERARELGMNNSVFENTTGLDDSVTKHLCSAYDIALMSKELLKHDIILKYSNIWQDSIRNGAFILTNTNRLVRYYPGCTGLKTGSTDKAGFCMSATAKRDGMHLIAVVMGAENREQRNEAAKNLLDYGFASYGIFTEDEQSLEDIPIRHGTKSKVTAYTTDFSVLLNKSDIKKVEKRYEIPENLDAPLNKDQVIGKVKYYLNEKEIGECNIIIKEEIPKISILDMLLLMLRSVIIGE